MQKIMARLVFVELLNERKQSLQVCKQMLEQGNEEYVNHVLPLLERNIERLGSYKVIH